MKECRFAQRGCIIRRTCILEMPAQLHGGFSSNACLHKDVAKSFRGQTRENEAGSIWDPSLHGPHSPHICFLSFLFHIQMSYLDMNDPLTRVSSPWWCCLRSEGVPQGHRQADGRGPRGGHLLQDLLPLLHQGQAGHGPWRGRPSYSIYDHI